MSSIHPNAPRVPMPGACPPPKKKQMPMLSPPENMMPSLKERSWTPGPVQPKRIQIVVLDR